MNKLSAKLIILLIVLGALAGPLVIYAEGTKTKGTDTASGAIALPDPLLLKTSGNEPEQAVATLLSRVTFNLISIIGAIAFLIFMFGGFLWIFSGGNEDQIKKGRDVMIWAAIGMIIIFGGYAIVSFLFKAFGIE